jgi:drug/metabolite transporter (DMT)-like permease
MTTSIGIGLAFVAMLCWGFGDFFIQRSARRIGNWETLFVISAFGSAILLFFVWRDVGALLSEHFSLAVLLICSFIILIAALLNFEALKRGKLSVIEPVWAFEVPAAGILAFFILGETISISQALLIFTLIVGLILLSLKETHSIKRFLVERGVFVAFIGAFFMGGANFFMGWSARLTDPLMANFFVGLFLTVATGSYLIVSGKGRQLVEDVVKHRALLLPMSIADNVAWVAFAFAMTLAPIAVAVALSESYIIVAVILGLVINKERLKTHQKAGLVGAIISVVLLAGVTIY